MTSPAPRRPVVSVVIPAYNAQDYIAATLESVLAQTFEHFEVIVVDDCSRDGTVEIVRNFSSRDPRVQLMALARNFGAPAGPRNLGVRAAKGEWIAFLDADDVWHRQKLEHQMRVLQETGAKFCSTQMVDFVDAATLNFAEVSSYTTEKISFTQQLLRYRTPTSSVLVSKDLVSKYPFNESLRFKAREDLDCWLHCHEEISWSVKIAHPMLGYRISGNQISGRKWKMIPRHFHVLKSYRFRSGRAMGMAAALFTCTHFLLAIYSRAIRGRL
jgi:teichuronic acid biosynthesis glycosyltransferase TuaG